MVYKNRLSSGNRWLLSASWLICFCLLLLAVSCKKYLDKKPSQHLDVPSTPADLQAILDNQAATQMAPHQLEYIADNYYLTTDSWRNLPEEVRKNYLWEKDAKIVSDNLNTWSNPYASILKTNFVLELLSSIRYNSSRQAEFDNIKGTALFYRSFMFHLLAQLYCKPYSATAAADPGIVLRRTSNVIDAVTRSTVLETYDQLLHDLKTAAELLPDKALFNTRPDKAAAYALLARVYLSMRDYPNAAINADASLKRRDTLLDYQLLQPEASLPVNPLNNPEILFLSASIPRIFNAARIAIVDSTLYDSYDENDWRKQTFFSINNGKPKWKGSYYANGVGFGIFVGIATDEMYLIRAECKARAGDKNGALNDVNTLLRKRWKSGQFKDLDATDAAGALNIVLTERRKELVFRGLRWSDLRRFNLENANITLKRIIDNHMYTLPPNDARWVLLIPELEINRSGIPQNPR